MNQPEIFEADVSALQQWLRAAWQQLGDPSLTPFARRELRNQMKQHSAELKAQLERAARQLPPVRDPSPTVSKPELRILV